MTKFYGDDTKLDFSDVLIVPGLNKEESGTQKVKYTSKSNAERKVIQKSAKAPISRNDVNLTIDFPKDAISSPGSLKCIPIIAANMDGVGTVEMHKQLAKNAMLTALVKNITDEELDRIEEPELVFLTIGISDKDLDRVDQYKDKFLKICIDTPNGYGPNVSMFVTKVRKIVGPKCFIMVGNVVTSEGAIALYHAGADCVKVGIGPGSVCTTRLKTGVGYPQVSAIMEIAKISNMINQASYIGNPESMRNFWVCADGGCTNPGDIAKAFVAGAHFVMIGGMLAGHDEGGGEIVTKYEESNERMMHPEGIGWVPVIDEKKYVKFYGMSSKAANEKHNGGLKGYRAAEGKEVLIPYKGPVQDTIDDILGGLRSTCTYLLSFGIQNLTVRGKLVKVNHQVNNVFK